MIKTNQWDRKECRWCMCIGMEWDLPLYQIPAQTLHNVNISKRMTKPAQWHEHTVTPTVTPKTSGLPRHQISLVSIWWSLKPWLLQFIPRCRKMASSTKKKVLSHQQSYTHIYTIFVSLGWFYWVVHWNNEWVYPAIALFTPTHATLRKRHLTTDKDTHTLKSKNAIKVKQPALSSSARWLQN